MDAVASFGAPVVGRLRSKGQISAASVATTSRPTTNQKSSMEASNVGEGAATRDARHYTGVGYRPCSPAALQRRARFLREALRAPMNRPWRPQPRNQDILSQRAIDLCHQPREFAFDGVIALAGLRFQRVAIQHQDEPAAVFDPAARLQFFRGDDDALAAHA